MRKLLSIVAALCISAFAGLSILPNPLHGLHPTGHGGIVLVPAGDGGGGDH
jgi:hypothetical protein